MVRQKGHWLVAGAAVLAVLLFVVAAALPGRAGFPLDDSWIHQTYARNLALTGRWAYVPGVSSAGSTAPLWTLLLAVGHLLRLPPLAWAYGLGGLCLVWLAWVGMALWRLLWPAYAGRDWLAGLSLVAAWPLVWAAASGMETLLFVALGLTLVWQAVARARPGWLGVLAGLLVLARPEGLLLLLLVGVGLLARPGRLPALLWYLLGAGLPLLPYFAFNLAVSGALWPNTFYAKQAEYAALLVRPLPVRFASLLLFSLGGAEVGWRGMTGAHLLLLPGLIPAGWLALRQDWHDRRLQHALLLLWAGGHVLLYAWRLPVTYQHGRYLWAALPAWILYGLAGWLWLLARLPVRSRPGRVLRRVAGLVYGLLLAIFFLFGLQAYATDVAFIENEMVDVARWLNQNTPPEALIAAHDIGAIGYFAQRPLLDLAGLITPELVDRLADEAALGDYVREQVADYLVTAPGWPYETITARPGVILLYSTGYAWTQAQGANNIAVYGLPGR